jgi:hypothetical protein
VYVVFAAGVVTLCAAAPPSDHDTNSYVVPPDTCVAGASMLRTIPTTLSKVSGVAMGCASSRSWRPAGTVAIVRLTLRGSTSRNVVWVCPAESRTVR